jgi:FixJ family two-component response regulator
MFNLSLATFSSIGAGDPSISRRSNNNIPSGEDKLELQETLNELGSDLPILFLTGHGDIPVSVKAIRGGAVNFLTKPVSEDVLLSAVGQALATHEKYIKKQ